MSTTPSFFATCPKGLEPLLAEELRALGATRAAETRAGVAFEGDLATAYRACLWSRLASRVLLTLRHYAAPDMDALYAGARAVDWSEHLAADGTLAVDANVRGRADHSGYTALKIKDAVVDHFRERAGTRPSVDTVHPDLRINLHWAKNEATLSVDLSGESLHRRGYRVQGVAAPLKENLAAAILLRANWPTIAADGGALVDPMCGSGTLPIEGALMAADIAPGLLRERFGFSRWRGHQPKVWDQLLDEARARREEGLQRLPPIFGYDRDGEAVRVAAANAERAGLADRIRFVQRPVVQLTAPKGALPGVVVANPPYGERIGKSSELPALYATLGEKLKQHFQGWHGAVFTGNPELGKQMGLRARRVHTLYNGALLCKLLHFDIRPEWFVSAETGPKPLPAEARSEGADMLTNRLRKNRKQLDKWAKKEGVTCYRLYDADMPEYAVAVDLYQGERLWAHVQEYQAPASVDPKKARLRLREALSVIPEVLDIPQEQVYYKVRQKQKGAAQYEKVASQGRFHEVEEYGCRFLVNFTDYLDTGLFLDHRLTRRMIQSMAAGKRFLNLFAYTGTATVHAARGAAKQTTSVDMSRTYLDWARRNLELNGFSGKDHELVQADCLAWLDEARRDKRRYELIFLDPPSFSTSKRMQGVLDIQRDHVGLIRAAVALLPPGGTLVFSNNLRRFTMDRESLADLKVEDITARTIPKDFERNPRIHNTWIIET